MMDVEKVENVCKGLECCADPGNCDPCPYTRGLEEVGCIQDMEKDAVSVIRELKAEIELLRQEKAEAVKRIEQCRLNCISGEKDCDSALDREGKEINRAKAYAYQWVLNIINKPTK